MPSEETRMPSRLGVDVGGTFTDLVLVGHVIFLPRGLAGLRFRREGQTLRRDAAMTGAGGSGA